MVYQHTRAIKNALRSLGLFTIKVSNKSHSIIFVLVLGFIVAGFLSLCDLSQHCFFCDILLEAMEASLLKEEKFNQRRRIWGLGGRLRGGLKVLLEPSLEIISLDVTG
jgi:hypothetical protein